MTNKELYNTVETADNITKEVTDVFVEMDTTRSMTTQAELNELMVKVYERLATESVRIEAISSEPPTQDDFKEWVENNIGEYSVSLFTESIK